ncbi:MAG: histidinol dehydrogenase [Prevotella sp.]|nr:histidinol dehydrogenase [Prevotella sp.]MCR5152289.1 histidinol dehydrogenase [Prevotella sp.]
MQIIRYPKESEWNTIVERPHIDASTLNDTVKRILDDIRSEGDEAVRRYEEKFDHVILDDLQVTPQEIDEAENELSEDIKRAIRLAQNNIRRFHESQRIEPRKVETSDGVVCWQKSVAIEKVGLYIPGGTAPLFSTVLMLATPAMIAGCKEIVLCSPPNKEGRLHPAILFAAKTAGVSRIYKTGGVQAIGAMAYGTESIPKVYKIFGPGNQYVMCAKQQVSLSDVAIDMPAGPSEVCVVCDETSDASFVAADLLSQAEHGRDSQVLMITTSEEKIDEVRQQIDTQIESLPRKEIAKAALDNSKIVLVEDTITAMRLTNAYAPEHLILNTRDYEQLAEQVVNAGSVFLGPWSCESAGDYASGTNHTLPTHGYATAYSGVNLDSFIRKITFQNLSTKGIASIGKAVEVMAAAEQLDAHRNAMKVRTLNIEK